MDSERHRRIEALFDDALALADPAARDEFLRTSCGDDEGLRATVGKLLNSYATWSAPVQPPATHGIRCGAYQCEELLGSGGMGAVYRARRADGHFDQEVAIKFLRGSLRNDTYRTRFLAERQILARLQHPNIARLLDGGMTPDGEPYLVMEFVRGEPLDVYCDTRKLRLRERIVLIQQVAEAVEAAHRNLVVHRDLKPSNILVTPDGIVKLLDFGTSKLLENEAAATEAVALTPSYASPEQLRGEIVATTADVFSLGVVLYELLTGSLPFGTVRSYAGSVERAFRETAATRPDAAVDAAAAPARGLSLTELRKQLRGDLTSILQKALAFEPADRYSSIAALSEDLRRYLEARPVLARKHNWTYVARRTVRRHAVGMAVGASVLIALVSAGVYSWRQQLQSLQRFEESHQTAKYILFDLFDRVSRLNGSTEVRARMAQVAQQQLDRLSSLPQAGYELRFETAAGYNRLAQVLGVPGFSNLGDTKAARANLVKAKELLEVLRREESGRLGPRVELARNALLEASMEMWLNGNTAAAAQRIADAERDIAPLHASRDPEWLHVRAFLRQQQADVADFQERWADEENAARKGLEELATWAPDIQQDELSSLLRALFLRQLGNSVYYRDHVDSALVHYREAQAVLRDADRQWPRRPRVLNALMQTGYDVGTTLDKLGRHSESLAELRDAMEVGGRLVAMEDRDQALIRNYTILRQAFAQTLADTGRVADAVREQEQVVTSRKRRVAAQPGVKGPARDLAFSLFVLGEVHAKTDRSRACDAWRQAMEGFEALRAAGGMTYWDWNQNVASLRNRVASCSTHPRSSGGASVSPAL